MKIRLFVMATTLSWLALNAESAPLSYSCVQCNSVEEITVPKKRVEAIDMLRDGLRRYVGDGRVEGCTFLVAEYFGHGFAAFGGSCDVSFAGKTSKWMLCADNGVGNFAAVMGARWWQNPTEFLAHFTDMNCVGG